MFRDLPVAARVYIGGIVVAGAAIFAVFLPHAAFKPILPFLVLLALSVLSSAFKVQLPIASGSNMSATYIVDIAALILRGPHAAMLIGAASGLTQSTVNSRGRNPAYRTLFNVACLVLTVQAAGQVYQRLGGSSQIDLSAHLWTTVSATAGMALTYYLSNTAQIALAIALSTRQSPWRIWRTDFAASVPNYVIGAVGAIVVIAVSETAGYGLMLFLAIPPVYLTYRMYLTGAAIEARQGAILEAANDAIVTMDSSLNIREFNPAAETMFGHKRMALLGRPVSLLLTPADRAWQVSALEQFVSTGEGPLAGRQVEWRGVRQDGSEFPVELSVARLSGDSRAAVTAFLRDITERRSLEERLRQSQKLEAIGRLAGGVAHDFNNILMSILGSADLIAMQLAAGDPAAAEAVEIKESVRRGAALTRQLLAFSRRQATLPRLVELGEVVANMDTMLRRLIGPEIEFEVRSRCPAHAIADLAQVEQVVLNLVVNARDAMPDGGHLTVTSEEIEVQEGSQLLAAVDGRAGRYAVLSVVDTGMGMDEKTHARLFEPFFSTKEHNKGTGLGLSIVYGIVKQSGGHISVESEPGQGAAFIIYFPAAAAGVATTGV